MRGPRARKAGAGAAGPQAHVHTGAEAAEPIVAAVERPALRATWTGAAVAAAATAAAGAVALLALNWRKQAPAAADPSASAREPGVYGFRVVRQYQHDPEAFTQGLLWLNGSLYESTGLYGRSSVREVRLGRSGASKVVRRQQVDQEFFGEGLVHWRGELLQLLWRRGDGLRYSAQAGKGGHLRLQHGLGFKTPLSDGWGIASDGQALLVTDGGAEVFHLDPESFAVRRATRVMDAGRAVEMINELEVVDGELWGNVYGTECLARISIETGEVLGWVMLAGLLDRASAAENARRSGVQPPDVLNGIAWDAETRRLFVTGKLWPTLFQIEVVPTPGVSLDIARQHCIPTQNIFRRSS